MKARSLFFGFLLLLLGVFVVRHFAQVEELGAVLRRARWAPLLLALALQGATLLNQPALYASLYRAVELDIRFRDLAPLVWAGHFVNVVTPSAGLGGTALLLADARRRGLETSRVALANTLYFLLNFVWFALLLGWGLLALQRLHDLNRIELVISAFLLTAILAALGALFFIALRPRVLAHCYLRVAAFLSRLTRRFLRREMPVPTADFVTEFAQALRVVGTAPRRMMSPIVHAMLVDGLEIGVLGACFAAFPAPDGAPSMLPLSLLVAAYAIGTLFLTVSVTPQGLGAVEGVMTALFVSLGVPLERAAVIVLAYRGLSFWVPLFIGVLASRQLFRAPPPRVVAP